MKIKQQKIKELNKWIEWWKSEETIMFVNTEVLKWNLWWDRRRVFKTTHDESKSKVWKRLKGILKRELCVQ